MTGRSAVGIVHSGVHFFAGSCGTVHTFPFGKKEDHPRVTASFIRSGILDTLHAIWSDRRSPGKDGH